MSGMLRGGKDCDGCGESKGVAMHVESVLMVLAKDCLQKERMARLWLVRIQSMDVLACMVAEGERAWGNEWTPDRMAVEKSEVA